jgi:shikimate kinase
MTSERAIRNLALIGFMGSGKSSVGRLAADLLHFTFLDTDRVIEARAGTSISEIFAVQGEPAFRDWEERIVEELARRTKTVIATGGGLPLNEANLVSLKAHALVLCLWASPETLFERVRHHSHRPLLKPPGSPEPNGVLESPAGDEAGPAQNSPDPLERIRTLLAVREPHYRLADVLVNTERRSVREVAAQVVHQFHLAQAAHP